MIERRAGTAQLRRHWPWLVLLLITAALHLWALDHRSFHHDEAIHAKLSFDLSEHGTYHYDPTYHGPLLYYLTALSYNVFGDSDFSARLPIALAGIGMLWVAWKLRRPFGNRAAWWTGLLFTISPMFLYFGRFLRMDMLEVFTASGAMLAWYSIVRGEPRSWIQLGVWTGLAFATKENAYVTIALIGVTCVLLAADKGFRTVAPAAFNWLAGRRFGVAASLATFVLVTVPIYTVGFTRPGDWNFPVKAISYWWAQHSVQRVGGPWWFHLPRLAEYEFFVLIAATVWIVRRRNRLKQIELFLFVFGVMSILMYIYLGEKVPWLGVHQVWAFLPLAGAQLARSLGRQGRWWSRSLAILGLSLTAVVSFTANFVLEEITPAQERVESLHFVQTSPELAGVMREGLAAIEEQGNTVASVSGEAVWPLTWHWRHIPVSWIPPQPGLRPPLVVCDPEKEAATREALGQGYAGERIPLRSWWLMYQGQPSVLDVARYFLTRVPWSGIGSTDVIVFRRAAVDLANRLQIRPPEVLQWEIGAVTARIFGKGWNGEVRGVAIQGERVAVADSSLSKVVIFEPDGKVRKVTVEGGFNQPEAVAWINKSTLLVADTWDHRVMRVEIDSGQWQALAEPKGGWFGPRAVAIGPEGGIVVADTGNKRLVVYNEDLVLTVVIDDLEDGSTLDEPGGVAWVDSDSILVCDTGNHRALVIGLDAAVEMEVELPKAWNDYLSRPQAVVLAPSTWLVSDAPASSLWLIDDGVCSRLDLQGDLVPSGLAWNADSQVLIVGDTGGNVWRIEIEKGPSCAESPFAPGRHFGVGYTK